MYKKMRSLAPNFRENVFRAFGAKSHTPGKVDFCRYLLYPVSNMVSKTGLTFLPPERKKAPLGVRLTSSRPSHGRVCWNLYPPEARQSFLLAGLSNNANKAQREMANSRMWPCVLCCKCNGPIARRGARRGGVVLRTVGIMQVPRTLVRRASSSALLPRRCVWDGGRLSSLLPAASCRRARAQLCASPRTRPKMLRRRRRRRR